jgi:hypothetical protein
MLLRQQKAVAFVDQLQARERSEITIEADEMAQSGVPAYRETHLEQNATAGWQRSESAIALLKTLETLQTAHFTIRYHAVDGAAVAEVAPHLDQLYEKLRHDFGLPVATAGPDITIIVVPEEGGNFFRYVKRTLVAPSPALHAAEMTATRFIYQAMVYPLTELVMRELDEQQPTQSRRGMVSWQMLRYALPLWVVWEKEGALTLGQKDVLRWLYYNAQTLPPSRQQMPASYEQICRSYWTWNLSPAEVYSPIPCSEESDQPSSSAFPQFPLHLYELLSDTPYEEHSVYVAPAPVSVVKVVAMASVVDYVVTTYDRALLARWVAALGDHTSWDSLVPEIFGISAADFEAGWLAYLEGNYGTSADHVPTNEPE